MERDRLRSVVESLLFAAEGPLTLHRLASLLEGVEKNEIVSVLKELEAEYQSQERGFRLFEVAGGYQMRTPKENADWIRRLQQTKPGRLSRPTLETLAIIAYKQPVTRAEIENIRGVDVEGVLSALLERRLIRIVARKDVPGRPFLYGTTAEFLELFNLKDLTQLPTLKEMEEMAQPSSPSPEPAEALAEEAPALESEPRSEKRTEAE